MWCGEKPRLSWELDDIFTITKSSLGQPSVLIQISSNHTRFIWNTNHYVCRAELKQHCFNRFHQWNGFFSLFNEVLFLFHIQVFCFCKFLGVETLRVFFHNFYTLYYQEVKVYDDIDLNHGDGEAKKEQKLVFFILTRLLSLKTINQITFIFPCPGFFQ